MPFDANNKLCLNDLVIGYQAEMPLTAPLKLGLEAGDVVCLIGENGVGKTTLLRTIAGLLKPLAGEILLGETDLSKLSTEKRAQQLAVVLTEREFPLGLTVLEVLELARIPHTGFFGKLSKKDLDAIAHIVEVLSLGNLLSSPMMNLSDGQRQRVLIGRALIQESKILLLDEPTTYLDLNHQIEILLLLKRIASEFKKTILLTTHHWELVLELSTKLWIFDSKTQGIREALAEELILNHEIEKTFHLQTASFDIKQGRFVLGSCLVTPIDLECIDPVTRQWVLHAFQKWGFYHQEQAKIRVVIENDKIAWGLREGHLNPEASLMTCLSSLKSLLGAP
jgi:iron complex transport system ATP-binding protein